MEYRYPATLEPDEEGRFLVRFGDLPEALTDGADLPEALSEAADCLSEALASRIVDGEEIPRPSSTEAGPNQHIISPSPTIAESGPLHSAAPSRYDGCRPRGTPRHGLAPSSTAYRPAPRLETDEPCGRAGRTRLSDPAVGL